MRQPLVNEAMKNFSYGRLTTLNYLKEHRDDARRHPYRRMQADRAIKTIIKQLRDRKLMRLRERLLRAQVYGDLHNVWVIENEIRAYEGRLGEIEKAEYTAYDEDF
jgi:hypothetical protein